MKPGAQVVPAVPLLGEVVSVKVSSHTQPRFSHIEVVSARRGNVLEGEMLVESDEREHRASFEFLVDQRFEPGEYTVIVSSGQGPAFVLELTIPDDDFGRDAILFERGLEQRAQARIDWDHHNYLAAASALIRSGDFYEQGHHVSAAAEVWADLAMLRIQMGEDESALHDAKRAMALYQQLNDSRGAYASQNFLYRITQSRDSAYPSTRQTLSASNLALVFPVRPKPVVLIVGEDLGFVWWMSEIFSEVGYQAVPTLGCRQAASLVEEFKLNVDVVAVSQGLPGLPGLIRTLRHSNRSVKVVLIREPADERNPEIQADAVLERPVESLPDPRLRWLHEIKRISKQIQIEIAV